uniref:Uncharacterized protein n=1 Tax=Solanum tuberosum TaxID=4113 RepID=M1BW42_SOLTU
MQKSILPFLFILATTLLNPTFLQTQQRGTTSESNKDETNQMKKRPTQHLEWAMFAVEMTVKLLAMEHTFHE